MLESADMSNQSTKNHKNKIEERKWQEYVVNIRTYVRDMEPHTKKIEELVHIVGTNEQTHEVNAEGLKGQKCALELQAKIEKTLATLKGCVDEGFKSKYDDAEKIGNGAIKRFQRANLKVQASFKDKIAEAGITEDELNSPHYAPDEHFFAKHGLQAFNCNVQNTLKLKLKSSVKMLMLNRKVHAFHQKASRQQSIEELTAAENTTKLPSAAIELKTPISDVRGAETKSDVNKEFETKQHGDKTDEQACLCEDMVSMCALM